MLCDTLSLTKADQFLNSALADLPNQAARAKLFGWDESLYSKYRRGKRSGGFLYFDANFHRGLAGRVSARRVDTFMIEQWILWRAAQRGTPTAASNLPSAVGGLRECFRTERVFWEAAGILLHPAATPSQKGAARFNVGANLHAHDDLKSARYIYEAELALGVVSSEVFIRLRNSAGSLFLDLGSFEFAAITLEEVIKKEISSVDRAVGAPDSLPTSGVTRARRAFALERYCEAASLLGDEVVPLDSSGYLQSLAKEAHSLWSDELAAEQTPTPDQNASLLRASAYVHFSSGAKAMDELMNGARARAEHLHAVRGALGGLAQEAEACRLMEEEYSSAEREESAHAAVFAESEVCIRLLGARLRIAEATDPALTSHQRRVRQQRARQEIVDAQELAAYRFPKVSAMVDWIQRFLPVLLGALITLVSLFGASTADAGFPDAGIAEAGAPVSGQ